MKLKIKKILLTGADGFLGSNIVRELLSRNYEVHVLIQAGRQTATLAGLQLTSVYGDLLDRESVSKAIEGMDAVIHAAANTKTWPVKSAALDAVNVEGTANVIAAVKKHGIQRMVYVGTANSFGPGNKIHPASEASPYESHKYGLGYMDSKYKAHQLVQEEAKKGLPVITVNPTFMFGPYDSGPSSGAMIMAIYHRKVPGYAPGGKNYIYVKDVATAVCNALTMGRIGESYILGHENLTYKEAFTLIANTVKVPAPRIRLSHAMVLAYGRFCNFWGHISKRPPSVNYPLARISCDEHYYSSDKAIRELMLPQTPIAEAIAEAFEWFRKNKMLQ